MARPANESSSVGAVNNEVASRQNKASMFTAIAIITVLALILFVANKGKEEATPIEPGAVVRVKDATSRNPSDKESLSTLNAQLQAQAAQNDALKRQAAEHSQLLADLRKTLLEVGQQSRERSDLDPLYDEISQLKLQLQRRQTPVNTSVGNSNLPSASVESGGARLQSPQSRGIVNGSTSLARTDPDDLKTRVVKVVDLASDAVANITEEFDQAVSGNLSSVTEPKVYDTTDFVPPNAFVSATVLVGVDASTGEAAQNDPQVASFLITGSARHVVKDGVLQETDLEGCIVNGAAFGELSTERVHIKLQRMTCPLEGGEVSVQEVQGHVTELGKAGVRGVVIERTGDKIARATIAGALQGLGGALGSVGGRGFNINSGGGFSQEIPNTQELVAASAGGAVSSAAGTLTEYYIERARAIEPVVSMPRGIAVELVFLNGFKARPSKSVEQ